MVTQQETIYRDDIFTEPDSDPDTLAQLGPLRPLAGLWRSETGVDEHPVVEGTERDRYIERYELQPIDPQTNGPQVFFGLRYHTHIVKPGEVEMFHDQVGYWLWEPATRTVLHSLTIPRGQALLAGGTVDPDATEFEVSATRGSTMFGIVSNPFLEQNFTTVSFRIRVTINADGTWSYDEDTVMEVAGRAELFHHTDRNTLTRLAEPSPNPLAAAAG